MFPFMVELSVYKILKNCILYSVKKKKKENLLIKIFQLSFERESYMD